MGKIGFDQVNGKFEFSFSFRFKNITEEMRWS